MLFLVNPLRTAWVVACCSNKNVISSSKNVFSHPAASFVYLCGRRWYPELQKCNFSLRCCYSHSFQSRSHTLGGLYFDNESGRTDAITCSHYIITLTLHNAFRSSFTFFRSDLWGFLLIIFYQRTLLFCSRWRPTQFPISNTTFKIHQRMESFFISSCGLISGSIPQKNHTDQYARFRIRLQPLQANPVRCTALPNCTNVTTQTQNRE